MKYTRNLCEYVRNTCRMWKTHKKFPCRNCSQEHLVIHEGVLPYGTPWVTPPLPPRESRKRLECTQFNFPSSNKSRAVIVVISLRSLHLTPPPPLGNTCYIWESARRFSTPLWQLKGSNNLLFLFLITRTLLGTASPISTTVRELLS